MRPADETGRRLVQKYVQRKFAKAARRDESQAAIEERSSRLSAIHKVRSISLGMMQLDKT